MDQQENVQPEASLAPTQQAMVNLWEEHMKQEFVEHNTEATLQTMVDDPYLYCIPMMMAGVGQDGVREYYSKHFIPQIPPDTEMTPVSRTIGKDRIVDEPVLKLSHSIEMDWMLPGISPTGKQVEVAVVVVVQFRDGKIANEHVYWDQASVLSQIGLIDAEALPVAGVESARKLLELAAEGAD